MVVTIGNYELLVKEEYENCHGCFYMNEVNAVCKDVGEDIEPQLDANLFHPDFGGCGLRNSILIPNTPQSVLTYLEEKLKND